MYTFKLNRPLTLLTTVGALAIFAAPTASNAEQLPSYASRDRSETIHGTISSVPGKYDLYLRDDRGFTDHVVLHDGTAIFPTGLQLGSGETVTISGHNAGNVFAADSIDTPYAAADGDGGYADPGYAYDDAPYAVGYPYYYYGYPYYGGYYPYASFGFYFGGGYYGHGYRGHGGYYGHGYAGHGGYYGRGSYGRVTGSNGARGFSSGARGFSGGARGFSGGGGRAFSGGGGHGGGGHR